MNKQELVAQIAADAQLSQADALKALNAITNSITNQLKNGESVVLIGFGTFKVSKRAARTGRNPRTGKEIRIKASNSAGFSAGKALKDALN